MIPRSGRKTDSHWRTRLWFVLRGSFTVKYLHTTDSPPREPFNASPCPKVRTGARASLRARAKSFPCVGAGDAARGMVRRNRERRGGADIVRRRQGSPL